MTTTTRAGTASACCSTRGPWSRSRTASTRRWSALTEPMAVGWHAVNQSSIERGRPAVVIGAGPVGLAVIAGLALLGAEPIVAADFSPTRRRLAQHMGAHTIIDPGAGADAAEGFARSIDAVGPTGPSIPAPVIFEAVGVPGVIDLAMTGAPRGSEIVVVGVCMEPDRFRPIMGIYKHLTVRFVLGWTPDEFSRSLHHLAEGRIDGRALITDEVPLDGVPAAFEALASPEQHVKILVRPND